MLYRAEISIFRSANLPRIFLGFIQVIIAWIIKTTECNFYYITLVDYGEKALTLAIFTFGDMSAPMVCVVVGMAGGMTKHSQRLFIHFLISVRRNDGK